MRWAINGLDKILLQQETLELYLPVGLPQQLRTIVVSMANFVIIRLLKLKFQLDWRPIMHTIYLRLPSPLSLLQSFWLIYRTSV